ncbi:ENDO BETA N-ACETYLGLUCOSAMINIDASE [Salix koriyanagi]|uniref:ENDO BETA N-ACETYLGLUCOSAMINIDASE n=1 Tax=Salix koriyanagi TaxID=2511006 RepID=A0A9Q0WM65_9ROSI|nr:ENDO BETA N-ACETYLGLUCOSAMINIDASE [Salix koriyanagi]
MNEMNKSTCYHQVSKIASERIIHGGTVAIDGHVLTEIRAVCYRKRPTHTELLSEFGADNQETAPDPSPAEEIAKQVDGNAAGKLVDTREYLGMAYVQAFYMSDPSISCHIGSLKFIIQVCAADGTCQELDDSP